jgi:D-hexose-6-phosphate mutarotase
MDMVANAADQIDSRAAISKVRRRKAKGQCLPLVDTLKLAPNCERALQIESSESLPDTVVWNPGAELCATLKDMQPDAWKRMLCVEAAAIEQPVQLEAGGVWRGWQRMRVLG